MQFLNPIWLLMLPVILLPVVIHLLNRRRYRTMEWGAMQFLLTAKRVNRGMARLRQILIMAARMAALAGLIFAVSRPLSSGVVGSLAGGGPETVIVLLDRSASMQQQVVQTGETKYSSGLTKIAASLQTVGSAKRIVLFQSGDDQAVEVDNPSALLELPMARTTEAQSDLPAMLQRTLDYITGNQTGRTDVWICSDAAENDWNPDSSRWEALNSGFAELEGVRFQLLNFVDPPGENLSVVVDRCDRIIGAESELVVDVTISRSQRESTSVTVPVEFTINGLRSSVDVELQGRSASLVGHRIPIDNSLTTGWGKVELASDSNASDNDYFFTFAQPTAMQTVVVSERNSWTRPIELAAGTPQKEAQQCDAVRLSPDRIDEIDWQKTTLLIWQAPLPVETVARQISSFVDSGRTVIFLPPEQPSEASFAGLSWGQWNAVEGSGVGVGFWNNNSGLLSKSLSGQALPVDDLRVYRHCEILGERRSLATLEPGATLLARATSDAGAVYFLATLPVASHSSLGRDGMTLFALVHRAIDDAGKSMGAAREYFAGTEPAQAVAELPVLAAQGQDESVELMLTSMRPLRAGVYGDRDQLIALNRPTAEDQSVSITDEQINGLFSGLDFQLIRDTIGNRQALVSEIWRLFFVVMGIGLLVEAFLCIPEKPMVKTKTNLVTNFSSARSAA